MKFIMAGEVCEKNQTNNNKKNKGQILKDLELNPVRNEELLKDRKSKTNQVEDGGERRGKTVRRSQIRGCFKGSRKRLTDSKTKK